MGLKFSNLLARFSGKKEISILMLGLESAGKTTILYKLKLDQVVTTTPTIGFNVETIKYKKIRFIVWDACPQWLLRPMWRHHTQNAQGIIYVIDSTDSERIDEAESELAKILRDESLKDALLLVFANKQDLSKAMTIAELTEKLKLTSLHDRNWKIQGTSAINGRGLYEGFQWLSTTLHPEKL